MSNSCALCELSLPKSPVIDEELSFCCMGCHAVYKILSSRKELEGYKETPLFQQALRSGLISNQALLDQIQENTVKLPEEEWQRLRLEIGELWCPSCAEVIKLVLMKEKGVRQCVVDYSTDLASIEFAPRYLSKENIYGLIKALGYVPAALEDMGKKAVSFSLYLRFSIAAFCFAQIMMFSYPIYLDYFKVNTNGYGQAFGWLSAAASIPIMTYCLWPILQRFYNSVKLKIFGMETLVIIGVATAFGMSMHQLFIGSSHIYFDSMAAIVVFVLLGKIIEARAKFSAKETLLHLHRSIPRRGRKRFPDGSLQFVLMKDITIGDLLVVVTGEKIPMDGTVIEGEGAVDESLMTGESIPVQKTIASSVLGGSLLRRGSMTIRVDRGCDQTLLQKIIESVEQDIGHKSRYIRSVDVIVKWFVPMILVIAFATGLSVWLFGTPQEGVSSLEAGLVRAVAILLISCPCAIGIAAPLAESLLMNGLASLGAIVRNRAVLRFLGKETTVVFDKTGTLTEGEFTILDGLQHLTPQQCEILKGLASRSTHPLSCAIAQALSGAPIPVDNMIEYAGKGLRGEVHKSIYHLGSESFLKLQNIDVLSTPELSGVVSQVYFAENGRCITKLSLGDRLKANAHEIIVQLGAENVVLLSGDSSSAVSTVANLCGIPLWYAQQTPLEKREIIEQLKQKKEIVLMMGDGINDAPALAAATIGVSVARATDLSIQVSDLLLTVDRLDILPKIRELAKKGHAVIRQNLFWAFFYNIIGVGLAVFGFFPPIVAALAMVLSSLIVLFNALRLR